MGAKNRTWNRLLLLHSNPVSTSSLSVILSYDFRCYMKVCTCVMRTASISLVHEASSSVGVKNDELFCEYTLDWLYMSSTLTFLIGTKHAKQYVELHDQVKVRYWFGFGWSIIHFCEQTSVDLLDTLEGFLSTFQTDLTAVSGQISDLQDRSKDIENRLKSRKVRGESCPFPTWCEWRILHQRIEKPLSSLLSDLRISPSLAKTILDTDVGDSWLSIIPEFEHRLNTLNARKRVKAARDLAEVAEGLRIVVRAISQHELNLLMFQMQAATKIRAFFLLLIQPIRANMSTNMQVLQTSILIKYRPLYEFLQSQAKDVSREIQSAYVAAARVYYETGFRRYTRILGWVKVWFIQILPYPLS